MTTEVCWPEPVLCEDCCDDALDGMDPAALALLRGAAKRILWAATGRRYGTCERTLRPCRKNCGSFWGGLPFPSRIGGEWVNLSCGSCAGACGCSTLSEFIAPDVDSVVAVSIDGDELEPEDVVAVYDRRRLVRIDGEQWPTCQDLGEPVGGPGTWSVTVMQGTPAPEGAEIMTGLLLCELAKACKNDEACRLPRRVQSVARQGVSFNFSDVFSSIGDMRTGLFEVDLWAEAARTNIGAYATISSVDVPRASVMTWPNPEGSI